METFQQDDFEIEMVGEVIVPDLSEILARIEAAAKKKESVTLTAGEARILTNHLEE